MPRYAVNNNMEVVRKLFFSFVLESDELLGVWNFVRSCIINIYAYYVS